MRTLSIVLALGACGDGHVVLDAASDPDVATPPDAASSIVSIVAPRAPSGARVYFQNADSTLVTSTALDASGTALAVMAAGGFVTLVEPDPPNFALTSWAGVKPGDHLAYGRASRAVFSMSITIPVDLAHDVTRYIVSSTCGNAMLAQPANGTTVTGTVSFSSCPSADLVVTGVDANMHAKVAFYVPDQPLAANGSIDLSSKTYTATVPRTYTLSNNPNPTRAIDVGHGYWTAKGAVFGQTSALSLTGSPATGSQDLPALPAGAIDVIQLRQSVPGGRLTVLDWGGGGGDYALDWASRVLPQVSVQTLPRFDVASRTVTWTTLPGGVTPDFAGAMLGVRRGGARWSWDLFGPSTTSVTFPVLPTDLADLNIVASDTLNVEFVDLLKTPGGWDAARPIIQLGPPQATSPTGQTMVSTYAGPTTQ